MNQCTHCQAEIPADAQFCSHCGTSAEEGQTSSAPSEKADSHEEKVEITSKHPAVSLSTAPNASDATATPTVPDVPDATITPAALDATEAPIASDASDATEAPAASDATALPTLRTRRMHSQPSISPFPQDPWVPFGSNEAEDTAVADLPSGSPEASSTIRQAPLTPIVATPLDQAEFDTGENSVQSLLAEHDEPDIEALDTVSLPTPAADQSAAARASAVPQTPAFPINMPNQIPSTPAVELPDAPVPSASVLAAILAAPADKPAHTPVPPASDPGSIPSTPAFPASAPEKQATPPPASTLPPLISSTGARKGRNRMLLVILLVVVVVLAGGAGTFALLRQNASTNAGTQCAAQQNACTSNTPAVHGKPSSLTFSGALTGTMSLVAKPTCQISSSGDLRTLLVNLSGTLNNQLYNFGFTIQHYSGPGTYSNSAPDVALLFATPGDITNGWSNSDPAASGSITVDHGEQTGSITYTLAGTGTRAKTQIQISGNWTCGN